MGEHGQSAVPPGTPGGPYAQQHPPYARPAYPPQPYPPVHPRDQAKALRDRGFRWAASVAWTGDDGQSKGILRLTRFRTVKGAFYRGNIAVELYLFGPRAIDQADPVALAQEQFERLPVRIG